MIDENRFEECVFALCEVYGKPAPSPQWIKITKSILDGEGVTTKEFESGVFKLMKTKSSKDVFNLPSPADFLEVIGKKHKTIDEIAKQKAQQAVSEANRMRFAPLLVIDCPISQWVIQNSFGGVSAFCWELDANNEKATKPEWVVKRFADSWLVAHDMGKAHHEPLRNENLSLTTSQPIVIGDATKAQLMIESKAKVAPNPDRVVKLDMLKMKV